MSEDPYTEPVDLEQAFRRVILTGESIVRDLRSQERMVENLSREVLGLRRDVRRVERKLAKHEKPALFTAPGGKDSASEPTGPAA